ncbi:MAG: methyltransferase domain-containing protein [Gemmatimonadetes bacterium]|nr:methyltransferase domain-containing protein [Gemmatimonadota bacterium]NIO30578.1 methyltransferase domain-containing protein [Gemmatimonadota bacterium]
MNGKAHWERIYATNAPDEVSWFQAKPETSLRMIEASGVGPDGLIIDVGGGASTLVDYLLDAGYKNVSVLDWAPRGPEQARARLGSRADEVKWIEADITRFEAPHRWDLWHDRAVFHFLTDGADRAAYRASLFRCVASGGQVIIATFGLEGPRRCSGLDVVRYSPDSLAAELGAGFTLVESEAELHRTPKGAVQTFNYCRFRLA